MKLFLRCLTVPTMAMLLSACASGPPIVSPPTAGGGAVGAGAAAPSVWRSADFVVLVPRQSTSAATLAGDYLGGAAEAWRIEDRNGPSPYPAGSEVVIPLSSPPPLGISAGEYQTIPVLCYHKFSAAEKGKMVITATDFERQLTYLRDHGYRVIPLALVEEFLWGRRALPRKAVAISIDDGYKSVLDLAFPLLQRFGFPATLFVYTDYVGSGPGALTWDDLKKMQDSGIISVQAHTKSHADLTGLPPGDERLRQELTVPVDLLARKIGVRATELAYPFGKTAPPVMFLVRESGYNLALTVDRGGNAFSQNPWQMRRNMIYGDEGESHFISNLNVSEKWTNGR